MQTVVLSGTGPHLKVKTKGNGSVLVVGRKKATKVNLAKTSDVRFAA